MGVFKRLCGGFLDALRVAGLIPGDPAHAIVSSLGLRRAEYRISDESLRDGIRAVASRLARSPRVEEYIRERGLIYEETRAEGKPRAIASYGTLNRRFGGEWDSILAWAGLEPLGGRTTGRRNPNPPKGPRVTKEVIGRALRAPMRSKAIRSRSALTCTGAPSSSKGSGVGSVSATRATTRSGRATALGLPPARTCLAKRPADLSPLEAMLDTLGPVGLRELELWVQSDLTVGPAVADKRAAELGALASMLNTLTPALGWSYPTIKQAEYDRRRPQGARTGRRLAEKYGGWKRGCKAAYGLKAEGRTRGRSHHAWPSPVPRGETRVEPYTREEVIRAVRACGLELACRPSSSTYVRWSAAKRRLARVDNTSSRIPTIGAVCRHFPAGNRERWRRVVEVVALTDEELGRAHGKRLGSQAGYSGGA
jgi:hypothetical protein